MRKGRGVLFQLALGLMSTALPYSAYADLPPPPRVPVKIEEMELYLELVVNDRVTGHIASVTSRENNFHIDADELRAVHILLDPNMKGLVDLSALSEVRLRYDRVLQRLHIRVPDHWLPVQFIEGVRASTRYRPEASPGALLNYDLYMSDGRGGGYASLWNELRFFGNFGVVRHTGVLSENFSDLKGREGYRRYDTSWTHVDDERILTYEAGDLVTRSLPWSNATRLGGFQFSRDFGVRPDIVTYPLPTFSGSAAVPSAVDLFINGHRMSNEMIDPGPFELNNMPYINGAGEAVIVMRDAQGRQVSMSVPFYVASTLLREGLSDFALSVGAVRENYGLRNFSYGDLAATGSWRHGLFPALTIEAMTQLAPSLKVAGFGTVFRLGTFGVIDSSATISHHDGATGHQFTLGYQYNNRRFNMMAGHIRRSADFTDLASYDTPNASLSLRQTRASASVVLGEGLGTIGASYVHAEHKTGEFRTVNMSYHKSLWGKTSLYVSANHDMEEKNTSALLQFVVPLGGSGTVVAGVDRRPGGEYRQRLNYSRSVPLGQGFGWSLGVADSNRDDTYVQSDVKWRARHAELHVGAYGSGGHYTKWGNLSGSVVFMDDSLFFANRIHDAFALVSTNLPDVPVRYENQFVGRTDANGHILVPSASSYYGAKYEIDPLDLPLDVSVPRAEQRAAVKLGSGRIIHFDIARPRAATLVLRDADCNPLKVGSRVVINDETTTYVGWDGVVYADRLKARNRGVVTLPQGRFCMVEFPFDDSATNLAPIGPLTCQ